MASKADIQRKFRFLLCMNCNRTLGHAQDDPKILRKLATLLEEQI